MKKLLLFLFLLSGCALREKNSLTLVNLQFVDRNGISEMINTKERLKLYEEVDFNAHQPYQKISRVFRKKDDPKIYCSVSSYYKNGQIYQSLDVVNGRAFGKYCEWYENGKLHISGNVIEGIGDLTEEAKSSWIFDQENIVWDEHGHILARIPYDKGMLSGIAFHFYSDGTVQRCIPYDQNLIEGCIEEFDLSGNSIGKTVYKKGIKEGKAYFIGDAMQPAYKEIYKNGSLIEGIYYDFYGNKICEIEQGNGEKPLFENGYLKTICSYQKGQPEGEIKGFNEEGELLFKYSIKNGKKHGEERAFFPHLAKLRLVLNWYEDEIHGVVKTWYEDGSLESQREYYHNKKNGTSLAWYRDGSLMLMEEYENDLLENGIYMRRGQQEPISKVEKGNGIATLYDMEGYFLRKITYQKGAPID